VDARPRFRAAEGFVQVDAAAKILGLQSARPHVNY